MGEATHLPQPASEPDKQLRGKFSAFVRESAAAWLPASYRHCYVWRRSEDYLFPGRKEGRKEGGTRLERLIAWKSGISTVITVIVMVVWMQAAYPQSLKQQVIGTWRVVSETMQIGEETKPVPLGERYCGPNHV